jgi:hypothetical protein
MDGCLVGPLDGDSTHLMLSFLDAASLFSCMEASTGFKARCEDERLWPLSICVHCGKSFAALENRGEHCIGAINKHGRRHKSHAVANKRELRNHHTLIANRDMVRLIREGKFQPTVDNQETCGVCSKTHLAWNVSDTEWSELPPTLHHQVLAILSQATKRSPLPPVLPALQHLCFRCYLSIRDSPAHTRATRFRFAILLLLLLLLDAATGWGGIHTSLICRDTANGLTSDAGGQGQGHRGGGCDALCASAYAALIAIAHSAAWMRRRL